MNEYLIFKQADKELIIFTAHIILIEESPAGNGTDIHLVGFEEPIQTGMKVSEICQRLNIKRLP